MYIVSSILLLWAAPDIAFHLFHIIIKCIMRPAVITARTLPEYQQLDAFRTSHRRQHPQVHSSGSGSSRSFSFL